MNAPPVLAGYPAWLADLKTRIREARLRAALAVNSEFMGSTGALAATSWSGRPDKAGVARSSAVSPSIYVSRSRHPRLSSDNLRYMKAFAEAWPDPAMLQRVVGKLPWGQNIELLAVKDAAARL
jgi:hypothetical protein